MGYATEQASRGSLEGLGLPLIFLFIDDAQFFATEAHDRRPGAAVIEDGKLARLEVCQHGFVGLLALAGGKSMFHVQIHGWSNRSNRAG